MLMLSVIFCSFNIIFLLNNFEECALRRKPGAQTALSGKLDFMILLAESPELLAPSCSRDDIARSLQAARIAGAQIYTIPPDFNLCETAENALAHVPFQPHQTPAIWLGYIPDAARYGAIYDAAFAKNIRLFNTPGQHARAQEFDVAYPFLESLTPRSFTLFSAADCPRAVAEIGFPMFLKGAIQSRKARGWRACVAHSEAELDELSAHLWNLENRSRGRVIARELVKLRYARTHDDFPLGREYRVFILRGEVLSLGYYWPGTDPLSALSHAESQVVRALSIEAANRLQVPYVAIDIGQLEDESWIVIEAGDAQFAGLSCNEPLSLWNRLIQKI